MTTHTGRVKFFKPAAKYGFLTPDNPNDKDVFLHLSALEAAGIKSVEQGQRLRYSVKPAKDGRNAASDIQLLS